MSRKLPESYFTSDVLEVSPDLLGKYLVRRFPDGEVRRYRITDVEAYRGEEDQACHARKGKTARTEVMYQAGGKIYVYLIYGIYWLLNIVTGPAGHPQAVLIRGVEGIDGPGRVGRELELDRSFWGEPIQGERLWVEYSDEKPDFVTAPRVGVDYAGDWKDTPWRFIIKEKK